jgi:hypothetical protein
MKNQLITILATTCLALGLVSCASTSSGVKKYPLNTCLVTGNELGTMGTPVTKVYGSQEIKFCCKACVSKFEANQQKYLAKLP